MRSGSGRSAGCEALAAGQGKRRLQCCVACQALRFGCELIVCPVPASTAVACFGGAIAISVLLYHFFAPGGHDCSFNITIITVALILCVAFSLMSLHPAVRVGLGRGGEKCRWAQQGHSSC